MMPTPLFCDSCGAANQSQAAYCRSCGHSLQAVKPTIYNSATGQLLANSLLKQRYHIVLPIGRGGMGAVYRAEDIQLGNRQVALKEMGQNGLNPQDLKEAAEAFKQEAIILARLQHPNLPNIFDHFEENGRWYLVMSFIEGETLASYFSHTPGGKLSQDEAVQIGIQLCTVLGYLHNQQPAIIFRDLKPANIMRTPDGHIYLIDFGIARHFKPGQAKDTVYYGSMGYAPPEQYGRAQTTPRTDIYSLGATLYQLLSGHDPSSSPFHFPLLQSLLPTIPGSLANLIMQMLELDAGRRPASILLVKQELEALSSSPVGRKTNLPPTVPASSQYAGPSHYASPPSPQIGRKLGVGTTLLTYDEQASSIAWSSDGKYLASGGGKLVSEGVGPATTVHCWEIATGKTLFILPNHSQWVHPVVCSPDGDRIALGRGDSTVQVREIMTGRQLHLYEGHSNTVYAVAWSPDGRLLASGSRDNTIRVWEVATGKLFHVYSGHSGAVLSLAWSPDGQWLASGSADRKVLVRQTTTGRARVLPGYKGHSDVVNTVTWSPDGRLLASGSWDKTVHVWESATGKLLYRYEGHSDKVRSVAWSPDGRLLASGSWDKTVQVWEATTDRLLYLYKGHANPVNAVAWSPDGGRIASGADTVQIWQAP